MKVLYDNDLERTKKNLDNTETTRQEETRENEVQERSSQKNEIEVYWPHTGVIWRPHTGVIWRPHTGVKEEIKKTSV